MCNVGNSALLLSTPPRPLSRGENRRSHETRLFNLREQPKPSHPRARKEGGTQTNLQGPAQGAGGQLIPVRWVPFDALHAILRRVRREACLSPEFVNSFNQKKLRHQASAIPDCCVARGSTSRHNPSYICMMTCFSKTAEEFAGCPTRSVALLS